MGVYREDIRIDDTDQPLVPLGVGVILFGDAQRIGKGEVSAVTARLVPSPVERLVVCTGV